MRYGQASLYVERPGEITAIRVSRKELLYKAESFIWEDTESERLKKARVLGRDLSNAPKADVLDFLLGEAAKDPKKIIEIYEGEDWKMQLFIIEAVDRGVIRQADGIYRYGEKMLGGSLEATVSFLKDIRYKKLVDSIKRDTYPNLLPQQDQKALEEELLATLSGEEPEPAEVKPTTGRKSGPMVIKK